MAATTTHSNTSKRKEIITNYPQFSFIPAEIASWSSHDKTIYYVDSPGISHLIDLLHELGHALLGHDGYSQDIELLNIETEAWDMAKQIAPKYNLSITQQQIDNSLDSYRDWLHARSRCPNCYQAGIQNFNGNYSCIICQTSWRANDAKYCGLKRYKNNPA